jgi:Fic family protein
MTTQDKREFLSTHPWLTFQVDLRPAPARLWVMLGECQSKCEHLAGVPLRPDVNRELHAVYLAKGVAATTAIEGNTLSEAEVRKQMEGTLTVPPSKEYLKQEVANILESCNLILGEVAGGRLPALDATRIGTLNRMVLKDLELSNDRAVPGEFRDHSVGVMDYRGAPAGDCEYLAGRLCEWLNGMSFPEGQEMVGAILKAMLAHLYLAWIHPFGDGNGRTARLVEVQILLCSGIPSPAAQLLSNHYNQTRSEYYRQLAAASKSGGDVIPFLTYAARGLRDGLREQIEHVRQLQWDIAWQNYVHERFEGAPSEANLRRKRLLLELSPRGEVDADAIPDLSAAIARDYASRTAKTLSRDLNALVGMGLLGRHGRKVWAMRESILAFLPVRARR